MDKRRPPDMADLLLYAAYVFAALVLTFTWSNPV